MAQAMLTFATRAQNLQCCSCSRNSTCQSIRCSCKNNSTPCTDCGSKKCKNKGLVTTDHRVHLNAVHGVPTTSALNTSTTIHVPYAAESQRNSGETPRNLRLEVASAAVRAEEAAAGDAVKEALATLTAAEKDAVLQRMAQKDPLYVSCFIRDVRAHVNTERVDNSDIPGWCRCGHCVTMESQRERLCCGREDECVTSSATFFDLCMKPSVVEVCGVQNYGYTYHRSNPEFSNRKFRSAAYRFYTLWQWGSLGAKHRVVLPSCVVARIRWAFPDPNQSYTGYQSCNE